MEITIPTEANDITIRQYLKYQQLDENLNDKDKVFAMISIFCNIDLNLVRKIKASYLSRIIKAITESLQRRKPFTNRFVLNGVEYGFIPKLDDMSLGEYMDLDNYLTKDDLLNRFMAVCYRPITSKIKDTYLIKEYNGTSELSEIMLDAPLGIALSSKVFFCDLGKDLSNYTLTCSRFREGMTTQQLQILDQSMDGIKAFTL